MGHAPGSGGIRSLLRTHRIPIDLRRLNGAEKDELILPYSFFQRDPGTAVIDFETGRFQN